MQKTFYFIVSFFFLLTHASLGFTEDSCGDTTDCHEYLVKFSASLSEGEVDSILEKYGLSEVEYFEIGDIHHVSGIGEEAQMLQSLNSDPGISYAEPDYEVQTNGMPNDPLFPELWALHNTGQSQGIVGLDMGVDDVWGMMTETKPIVVAVLDSGIDYKHEDLAAHMWVNPKEIRGNGRDDEGNGYIDDVYGYDFVSNDGDPNDDFYHGTHMAGTIGAVSNNGVGVTGVTPNVRLMALKFMDSRGSGNLSNAIRAINYAVRNGAKIINNSWNFTYPGLTYLPSPTDEPVKSLRDAIQKADEAGVIFVASSGNAGQNNDKLPYYPSSYSLKNIVSVTATNNKDQLPTFANYGATTVDLAAPGTLIFSTYPTWKMSPPYHVLTGTSNAAPHVVGALALLWSENPTFTHRQIIDLLLQGVRPVSALVGKSVTGGTADLSRAMNLTSPWVNHPPVANAGVTQYKKVGERVNLRGTATDADGDSPLIYKWTVTAPLGSRARLIYPNDPNAFFIPDLAGTYTAKLVVSDGEAWSYAATSKVYVITATATSFDIGEYAEDEEIELESDESQDPDGVNDSDDMDGELETSSEYPYIVIQAEKDGDTLDPSLGNEIGIGEAVQLDGTRSNAEGENDLEYEWVFVERPFQSEASLQHSEEGVATFVPDAEGRYTVRLTVTSGKYTSTGERSFMARELNVTDAGDGVSATASSGGGCSLNPQR